VVSALLDDKKATLAFVASDTSLCSELEIATRFTAATAAPLLVSAANACRGVGALRATGHPSPLIGDIRQWRHVVATAEVPTEIQAGLPLYDLDGWGASFLQSSNADIVFTPSYFVSCGDWPALDAVLAATSAIGTPGLVTVIPVDAAMLGSHFLPDFLGTLHRSPRRRFAFIFAAKKTPLQNPDRLSGLRVLLSEFPGSWVIGVDALVATDALAHGAGFTAVGTSSGHRWPQPPGDCGGPPARNFLPGLFLRDLLEFRSPDFYADWYADSPSPWCTLCGRCLDVFEPDDIDKRRIIEHNLHAIHSFAEDLLRVPANDRPAWLRDARLAALDAHGALTSRATPVRADPTLRYLCEMDDPQMRSTRPSGAWISAM